MVNDQTAGFSGFLEAAVVVSIASAAILDAVDIVVIVYHLMQEGGADLLYGSAEGARAQIDFVGDA